MVPQVNPLKIIDPRETSQLGDTPAQGQMKVTRTQSLLDPTQAHPSVLHFDGFVPSMPG